MGHRLATEAATSHGHILGCVDVFNLLGFVERPVAVAVTLALEHALNYEHQREEDMEPALKSLSNSCQEPEEF